MNENKTAYIISYIPMINLQEITELAGKAFDMSDPQNNDKRDLILKLLDERIVDTSGVLWSYDQNANKSQDIYASVVVQSGAKELLEHMNTWADNDISERFRWNMKRNKDIDDVPEIPQEGYTFLITADPFASIERWKAANEYFGDNESCKEITNYTVLCQPIDTITISCSSVNEMIQMTGIDLFTADVELYVSIVDIADVTGDDGKPDHDKFIKHGKTCRWMKLKRQGATVRDVRLPKPSDN